MQALLSMPVSFQEMCIEGSSAAAATVAVPPAASVHTSTVPVPSTSAPALAHHAPAVTVSHPFIDASFMLQHSDVITTGITMSNTSSGGVFRQQQQGSGGIKRKLPEAPRRTVSGGMEPKRCWSKDEDRQLLELIRKHGPQNWSMIAQELSLTHGVRSGKSCRLRWVNELRDGLSKAAFSDWEVAVLVRAVNDLGNKWAKIATLLPGRTDNSVKNRWNCSVKKRLDEYLASNPFLREGRTLEWLLANPNATAADGSTAPPPPPQQQQQELFGSLMATGSVVTDEQPASKRSKPMHSASWASHGTAVAAATAATSDLATAAAAKTVGVQPAATTTTAAAAAAAAAPVGGAANEPAASQHSIEYRRMTQAHRMSSTGSSPYPAGAPRPVTTAAAGVGAAAATTTSGGNGDVPVGFTELDLGAGDDTAACSLAAALAEAAGKGTTAAAASAVAAAAVSQGGEQQQQQALEYLDVVYVDPAQYLTAADVADGGAAAAAAPQEERVNAAAATVDVPPQVIDELMAELSQGTTWGDASPSDAAAAAAAEAHAHASLLLDFACMGGGACVVGGGGSSASLDDAAAAAMADAELQEALNNAAAGDLTCDDLDDVSAAIAAAAAEASDVLLQGLGCGAGATTAALQPKSGVAAAAAAAPAAAAAGAGNDGGADADAARPTVTLTVDATGSAWAALAGTFDDLSSFDAYADAW